MDDNIVISGISGRYPECQNIKEFAEALFKGVDLITVDDRRYPVGIMDTPRGMGKISELDKFDAAFFGIHPKQADFMDPRQRILQETIYECIVDAGFNPKELRGSKTGVYVGIGTYTNVEAMMEQKTDGYSNIGVCLGLAANRASYCFDFKGPSYSLDTACSSSFYAFVNAVKDMKLGVTDSAIVGASHICVHPHESAEFHRLSMMAPDCKCKVFSTLRDGYVRSEAIISVLLQKEKDSRRIYSTVLAAASNADGYKLQGITFPSSETQLRLMRDIYTGTVNGGLNPNDVSYVETHGTGTPAGDLEEMRSIDVMFCKNRGSPLLVGSVKSNMGHAEISSGLASISKLVVAMESGIIPANIHAEPIDTELPGIKDGTVKIVTENIPLEKGIIALNSFGFGGANAHVALKPNPKEKTKLSKPLKHRLVEVSGRTREAVSHFLDGIEENSSDNDFLALVDEIHKMNIDGHHFRGYTTLGKKPQRDIDRYIPDRPVWFIYTGMGSQWNGMGRDLMKIEIFRNAIEKCAAALKPHNVDLVDVIMNEDPKTFDSITHCFCGIAAVEVALTDVLYSFGIVPDNIAGHSLGEVGCSYADGKITREQAVLLAYARGYASENVKLPAGQMAAVALSKEECQKLLPDDIFIACYNGKNNVTIAGPLESTIRFVDKLTSMGIFAKKVNTGGFAYHSKYVTDGAPLMYNFAKKALETPVPRSSKWISTSVPESKVHESWTKYNCAEYHTYNFANPVLFDQIYPHVPDNAIVIEVAPHGLMQAILKRELSPNVTNIPLVNRASDDNEKFLLSAIGKFFIAGGQPNLRGFYKEVSFPVGRGTQMLSPLVQWDHSISWYVPFWKHQDSFGKKVTINISDENYSYLRGHNIDGRVLMPATGYMELAWQVFAYMHLKSVENFPVIIENVKFKRATVLPPSDDVTFLINVMKQSGNFEIFEGGSVVVTGKIATSTDIRSEFTNPPCPVTPDDGHLPLQTEDLYKECHLRSYMYNGAFQGVKECDVHGLQGTLEWKGTFTSFLDTMMHLNILADAKRGLQLPTSIEKVIIDPAEHLKQVSERQNELPVFYNPIFKTTRSGAIEIIAMETSKAPRRQKTNEDPILETYEFVPYEESIKTKLTSDASLEVALQIILQNCRGLIKRPRICAVSQNDNSDLIDKIKKVMDKQAMSETDFVEYKDNKNHSYDAIAVDENSADDIDVGTILKNLSENGFVLYLGDFAKVISADLQIVYQAVNNENNVYLMRPNNQFPTSYSVVNIRNTDFEWLNKIRELVKSKDKKVVYLFSQGEETSGIIGLLKCMLAEPIDIKIRLILIENSNFETFSVDDEFYREQLMKDLTINVLRGNQWGTYVHLPLNPIENKDVEHAVVQILTPGDLSTLKWVETSPEYIRSEPKSPMVYVFYSSLNFRDVMLATGKLQLPQTDNPTGSDIPLGLEYAGVTADGKRVMGMLSQESFSLQVQSDPVFTWEIPDEWSLEEAVTVPSVYATCYYAMIDRGEMQPGESILIHAGSGGVGLAAISIALSMGCTVYTTVGTKEKKEYLQKTFPQLRAENIGNSRNRSFRKMIIQNTNGKGVDLVLNSLSADLFQESLKCIAMRGRFLEIGKVDFFNGTPIDSKMFLKNCSFHGILLDELFGRYSKIQYRIKNQVIEGVKSGAVKPLLRTVFDDTEVEDAFRYLSSGKHKGKVLIRLRKEDPAVLASPARTISAIPKVYFHPKKSYILIGGLGGFGLELADWMIGRGATKIVLNSRRGISNGYQSYCLKKWSQFDEITVRINKDNTATLEGSKKLVETAQELGPLGGVFNMALVLRDSLIENQTEEMFEEVFKSKVFSGQNMDKITRDMCPELDHFVVFSSIACGRGNAGQSNYGMANSVLERLCEKRKREKLPGLAVQWGPVGDVGYLAKTGVQDKVFDQMLAQNIISCLNTLEKFILQETAVGASTVLAKKGHISDDKGTKSPVEIVAHILGLRNIDLVDKSTTLSQLGLDSLMVAEIKQTLYRNFQLELDVDEIRDLTFDKLTQMSGSCENGQSTESTPLINGKETIAPEYVNIMIAKDAIRELNHFENTKRPIFFIHPIEGQVDILEEIAGQLKSTVYGLQCTKEADYDNLNDYARYFIQQIKNKQPEGPYLLCGYSYGGILALEIGLQLEKNGERVDIISIDGSPAYVRTILDDGFVRQGKSVHKSQAVTLAKFSSVFGGLDQDEVLQLLMNATTLENQLQAVGDLISKETGLNASDVALAADRYYKRCHAIFFYEPKGTLKGNLLLFRREDNEYMMSEDYGLEKICEQKVEVLKLKGDHRTILLGDNIRRISEKINEILQ